MFAQSHRPPLGFGSSLTRVGKIMLIGYVTIYVLQLLVEVWLKVPVYRILALSPLTSGQFQLWQLITHPLIHNPGAPIGFLIDCLVFFFFAGTIESSLGTRGFIQLYIVAAVGGLLGALLFGSLASFGIPSAGMMPSLLALIVVFGLLRPESTILLFFIIPIKAKFISYGTVIITALTFLAQTNPHGAYHLGGIGLAWLYFRSPGQWLDPNYWRWKLFSHSQKKRRAKFDVIDGKKDNDKPTIH